MSPSAKQPLSSRRHRRQAARQLLAAHDPEAVRVWARTERNPLAVLSTELFTAEPLTAWRAIEAIGIAAGEVARKDIDSVERTVRRNFWMMNDESGNVGWHAPQTIGEILYRVPELIEQFAPLLPAFFVEEPFERGAYWAVARIAACRAPAFAGIEADLIASLTADDPPIRYFALKALSLIDPAAAAKAAAQLGDDIHPVNVYSFETGQLEETSVGRLAASLLPPGT